MVSHASEQDGAHGSDDELRVETRLALLGRGEQLPGQPSNVPIVPASNFRAAADGSPVREYARGDGTPGWEAFEELVGDLEGGPAVSFASGMAAAAAVLDLLPVGARVVVPQDSYTGVRALLADGHETGRWRVQTLDMTRDGQLAAAIDAADLVWLETPSNPMLHVVDIAEVTSRAASSGALVAVDSTFATPLLQSPLSLGADLVVHSATKFIGGHSDLLLGVVACRLATHHERLLRRREVAGATPGALESFLALRGARTLALRLAHAQRSASELAHRLAAHSAVARVHYPGLPDHPHHEQAASQMRGFGAVLSFEVDGATTADRVCAEVQVVVHATSLGGVETTIERRAKLAGHEHVPAGLLRLSIGSEHVEDLWADLARSLAVATRSSGSRTARGGTP
jgi:cystathionine gamma-synthase